MKRKGRGRDRNHYSNDHRPSIKFIKYLSFSTTSRSSSLWGEMFFDGKRVWNLNTDERDTLILFSKSLFRGIFAQIMMQFAFTTYSRVDLAELSFQLLDIPCWICDNSLIFKLLNFYYQLNWKIHFDILILCFSSKIIFSLFPAFNRERFSQLGICRENFQKTKELVAISDAGLILIGFIFSFENIFIENLHKYY